MMNVFGKFGWQEGRAICYSGFRDGQRPGVKYPTYEEVKEDLLLLHGKWKHLRLYDCDNHAATVLKVIQNEGLDFNVMLGAYIEAEMNNFACPWGGGIYEEEKLLTNRFINDMRVQRLIDLANAHPQIISSLSVGNEACVDWTDHYVSVERVIDFALKVKKATKQPVTFCENYVPWLNKLKPLAEVVDFISIHTYPVWEYKHLHEAIDYTRQNYESVLELFPGKPIVITEAGWATNSNGIGIDPEKVNQEAQKLYFEDLMEWAEGNKIMVYFFEAFDENWKGSDHPNEPEKHWGLFHSDRTRKLAVMN
jgi:exo-beta-1,3-glucanase (GH17 family)